jgi:cytochrome c biogenesis protein CcmG, thiol:disulfide interchange protein DsbE
MSDEQENNVQINKQRLFLFIPLIVFIVLAILFWRGLSLDPNTMPSALINKPVPAFNLPVLPAAENPAGLVRGSEQLLKGKVSLLNVWATWCVTCRQEHEFLMELKQQGVIIYGINYKDESEAAQKWLAELHNPYVLSVEDADGRLGLNLGVFGAPETYVVDKEGVIRYKHIGDVNPQVWEEKLKPLVASLSSAK